jgi:hypothetical protein
MFRPLLAIIKRHNNITREWLYICCCVAIVIITPKLKLRRKATYFNRIKPDGLRPLICVLRGVTVQDISGYRFRMKGTWGQKKFKLMGRHCVGMEKWGSITILVGCHEDKRPLGKWEEIKFTEMRYEVGAGVACSGIRINSRVLWTWWWTLGITGRYEISWLWAPQGHYSTD